MKNVNLKSIFVTGMAVALGVIVYSLVVKRIFSEEKVGALGYSIAKRPRGAYCECKDGTKGFCADRCSVCCRGASNVAATRR